MPDEDTAHSELADLRRRLSDLDREREQALVAAEDAREEALRLAQERDDLQRELLDRTGSLHESLARVEQREAEIARLRAELTRSTGSLQASRSDTLTMGEELQVAIEELQVMTEDLEEANETLRRTNEDLERRVDERTAQLSAAIGALRSSEERLRVAQKCAGAGIWDWDIVNDRTTWSPEYYDLLGRDPADFPASHENWLVSMHPDDRPLARQAMADALSRDGSIEDFRLEFRVVHPDKGERWLTGLGQVIHGEDGQPVRMAGLVIDITERRRMEEDLHRAKEAAENANQAKTRFLAAASHDLRQPIQAATLYLELLRRRVRDDGARDVLDRLSASIDGLRSMLGGLLDLSRLEAGVIKPVVVDFVPKELMTRLAAEFKAQAERAGIDLRWQSCSRPVSTDPHLLERVLRNLVANAITHNERGRVLLACRHRSAGVEFQVWDTGPGIPPQYLDSIFEEFRQLDNPERNSTRGFGLGLAIVARIVRLLDLKLTVRSTVGRGSVFSILVPVARSVPPSPAEPGDRVPLAAGLADANPVVANLVEGRLAILVEDDAFVREALSGVLESWGLRVLATGSPEDLERQLAGMETAPNLVIADYRLPSGATGRSVIELVRRRWPVPAIILTGDTAPERLREAQACGCRLLHKPIEPMELARTLEGILRN